MAVLAVTTAVLGLAPGGASARGRADQDALTQLAERYAPIVMLQRQEEPCERGEPYAPMPVGQILDQPDVVLRDEDGHVLVTAPTADDLADAPEGSNLDFPGDAGNPGCSFEERFGRRTSSLPPTQYVRLGVDAERPGQFAIQYWWWYVYNDWNDVHEGDWEMSQIVFDAATPEEALAQGLTPTKMALSQHFGTEVHDWADVPKEGDRPIVYAAAGSHAGYYSAHRWFGTDGAAGFGCDDTRGPSDRVDPQVVVMPQLPVPGDGFGWMVFKGRWGERLPALNDSETGPQTSTQWIQPIRWMEDQGRSAAVQVPEIGGVTAFFCVAAAKGSVVLNAVLDRPLLVGGFVALVVVGIVVTVRRTRWRPVITTPVVTERFAGQILTSAWARLRAERRRFMPIALFVFAGSAFAAALQWWLVRWQPLDTVVDVVGRDTPLGQLVAIVAGFAVTVPVAIIALAWSVQTADDDAPDRRLWRAGLLVPSALLMLTVLFGWIVVPLGAYLLARWFVGPAVGVTSDAGDALRLSAQLSRGRRIRTFLIAALATGAVFVLGLFVGTIALILTSVSFTFVNILAGVTGAVLLPWMGIVVAMTYGDLRARHAEPPS